MKKRRVQNFSAIGDAFEVPPGGKYSNFGKKGAIFKVSVCNENKNIFDLASGGGVLKDILGLKDVLEDTFSSPWPWSRSLKSSKIVLSSARGKHYFLNG